MTNNYDRYIRGLPGPIRAKGPLSARTGYRVSHERRCGRTTPDSAAAACRRAGVLALRTRIFPGTLPLPDWLPWQVMDGPGWLTMER